MVLPDEKATISARSLLICPKTPMHGLPWLFMVLWGTQKGKRRFTYIIPNYDQLLESSRKYFRTLRAADPFATSFRYNELQNSCDHLVFCSIYRFSDGKVFRLARFDPSQRPTVPPSPPPCKGNVEPPKWTSVAVSSPTNGQKCLPALESNTAHVGGGGGARPPLCS